MPKYTMRNRHGLGDKKMANPGPGAQLFSAQTKSKRNQHDPGKQSFEYQTFGR